MQTAHSLICTSHLRKKNERDKSEARMMVQQLRKKKETHIDFMQVETCSIAYS